MTLPDENATSGDAALGGFGCHASSITSTMFLRSARKDKNNEHARPHHHTQAPVP